MDADLVLEGGGVKGIGLVGAYTVLKEEGYTFHRIAGTSAGAIVGALAVADIPIPEIRRIMREVDYGKFQDQSFLDHLGLVGNFAPQQPQHRALLALGRQAPAPLTRWPVAASVMGARRRASAPYRRVRHAHLLALLH